MSIKWLVLSDIHSIISDNTTHTAREKMLTAIKSEEYSFVLIIGDCLHQSNGIEKAASFIKNIKQSCGNDVKIYICPGNHDIIRDANDISRCNMIKKIRETHTIPNKNEIFYETAYKNFFELCDLSFGEENKRYQPAVVNDEYSYRIISIDTCLFSSDDKDAGNLFVMTEFLSKISIPDDNKLNIVIMHHGVDFLEEDQQLQFQHWLKDKSIDIVFSGHSHIPNVNILSETVYEDNQMCIFNYVCGAMHKESDRSKQSVSYYSCEYNIESSEIRTTYYHFGINDYWGKCTDKLRQFSNGCSVYIPPRKNKMDFDKLISETNILSCTRIYNSINDIDLIHELQNTNFVYYFGIKGDRVFKPYDSDVQTTLRRLPNIKFKLLVTNPFSPYWINRVRGLDNHYPTEYDKEKHFGTIYDVLYDLYYNTNINDESRIETRFHEEPIRYRIYIFKDKMFFSLYSDKHSMDAKMYEFQKNTRFYNVAVNLFFDLWNKYNESQNFPVVPHKYNHYRKSFSITPSLVINVTDKCNLSCEYCPDGGENLKQLSKNDYVSIEKIKMLMEAYLSSLKTRISPLGKISLRITGGEPLISDAKNVVVKLLQYILECKSNPETSLKFDRIVLDTNGIFLNEFYSSNIELIENLKDILLFKISLDSTDINIARMLMKNKKCMSKHVLDNVVKLITKLSKQGFSIEINTVLTAKNYTQVPIIHKFAEQNGLVGIKVLSKNNFSGKVVVEKSDIDAIKQIHEYINNLEQKGIYYKEYPYLNDDSGARMDRLININNNCKFTFVNHEYDSSPRTYSDFCKSIKCQHYHKCATGLMSITMRADGEVSFCRHSNMTYNINNMEKSEIISAVDNLMDAFRNCHHHYCGGINEKI